MPCITITSADGVALGWHYLIVVGYFQIQSISNYTTSKYILVLVRTCFGQYLTMPLITLTSANGMVLGWHYYITWLLWVCLIYSFEVNHLEVHLGGVRNQSTSLWLRSCILQCLELLQEKLY